MKRSHMKTLVSKLMRLYPKGFPANMDAAELSGRIDDYMAVLGDLTYEEVDEAINELVKTQTFLPSVAEIREAVKAVKKIGGFEPVDEFTDEDGYRFKRIDGQLVCVYRPHNAYVPADPGMRAFLEEKRRIYAEVGAPLTYTMRQVRELAKKKGIKIEVVDDKVMLSRIFGGIEKQEEIKT